MVLISVFFLLLDRSRYCNPLSISLKTNLFVVVWTIKYLWLFFILFSDRVLISPLGCTRLKIPKVGFRVCGNSPCIEVYMEMFIYAMDIGQVHFLWTGTMCSVFPVATYWVLLYPLYYGVKNFILHFIPSWVISKVDSF